MLRLYTPARVERIIEKYDPKIREICGRYGRRNDQQDRLCGFTPGKLKLILSRYNGKVKQITDYGEEAYGHYLRYNRQP